MAVLVEAISVIVRRNAIESKYRCGWKAFVDDVPNSTLCADDEIALDLVRKHGRYPLRLGKWDKNFGVQPGTVRQSFGG